MKKSMFLFALPMLAVALFIGCEGDQGPQGDQGDQGIQGEQGVKGDPGTANVIYSEWAVLDGVWRDTSMFGGNFKVNHLIAADLTQDVIDNGAVLCYTRYAGSVTPLPYSNLSYTLAFQLDPERVLFTTLKPDLSGGVELINSMEFRYIIIPGGTAATKSAVDFNYMSYREVCAMFSIPE
ncbi:MAG TPA: hypothetical protein VK179_03870 [Bacteroidales bacterium]|nr:hypothetical protein [Bacteroidales bacterium]